MAEPTFSVIVPVHSRTEFVLGAVDSVLGQTVPRNDYEVIVVRNFEDSAIGRQLEQRDVVDLATDASPLGAKLLVGLAHARGRLLAFLEDDDLYEPRRLATVGAAFTEPELGYFHNAVQLIDLEGGPVRSSFRSETERRIGLSASDRSRRSVLALLRASPHFNLSSTVVDRSVIEIAGPFLGRTNLTCDNLIFYAGLLSRRALRNEGLKLTRYRLHRSSSWPSGDYRRLMAEEEERERGIVEGFSVIAEMVRGHPVEQFAECDLLERRAKYSLAANGGGPGFPSRELPRLIACRMLRQDMATTVLSLGLLLRRLAPESEQRLYARYVSWRLARIGMP